MSRQAGEALLELQDIRAGYGSVEVLHDVTLRLCSAEIVALLGANGAGKSTTLLTISQLVHASSGSIKFRGDELVGRSANRVVAAGISHVPEGREVFRSMSVAENLALGAHIRRGRREVRRDYDAVFSMFPRLRERARQRADTLSGGEQQMLLIARALMSHPAVLMLDEPSLGLSPQLVQQIFSTIRAISASGIAILIVEQNASLALEVASYAYILENGRVVKDGQSSCLRADGDVRRAYLGI